MSPYSPSTTREYRRRVKALTPDLVSSFELVSSAFPDGVDDECYVAVLWLLLKRLHSRHGAALVMACCREEEYGEILNDIYGIGEWPLKIDETTLDAVRQRLMPYGFEKWWESAEE